MKTLFEEVRKTLFAAGERMPGEVVQDKQCKWWLGILYSLSITKQSL